MPWNESNGILSDDMVDELRDLRDDDNVEAIVLRVNSPGGSALASELILREILRVKAKKPVVVSMGSVAASGGYYISCAGDYVYAQPNTITGSIGVVSLFPTAQELYEKAEARIEVVKKGKWAEFFHVGRDLTPEQEGVLLDIMNGVYDEFTDRVAAGRNLSKEFVDSVGQGRVWTGTQALDRKLVDEIGGLDEAVHKAAELAKVDTGKVHIRYYPGEADLFSFLMKKLDLASLSFWERLGTDPQTAAIQHAAEYLDKFYSHREFVQLASPIEVE
jgi:protease-4